MKKYTFGQVVDKLELGQVAIKVNGLSGKVNGSNNTEEYIETGIYFNENNNNTLSVLGGNGSLILRKSMIKGAEDYYVILDRKDYDAMLAATINDEV